MKKIKVYFKAVTKVQVGHITIDDGKTIDDYMSEWMKQGYAKIHYVNNYGFVYVPWTSIIYCQCE
jgi:hypothetical protein